MKPQPAAHYINEKKIIQRHATYTTTPLTGWLLPRLLTEIIFSSLLTHTFAFWIYLPLGLRRGGSARRLVVHPTKRYQRPCLLFAPPQKAGHRAPQRPCSTCDRQEREEDMGWALVSRCLEVQCQIRLEIKNTGSVLWKPPEKKRKIQLPLLDDTSSTSWRDSLWFSIGVLIICWPESQISTFCSYCLCWSRNIYLVLGTGDTQIKHQHMLDTKKKNRSEKKGGGASQGEELSCVDIIF